MAQCGCHVLAILEMLLDNELFSCELILVKIKVNIFMTEHLTRENEGNK